MCDGDEGRLVTRRRQIDSALQHGAEPRLEALVIAGLGVVEVLHWTTVVEEEREHRSTALEASLHARVGERAQESLLELLAARFELLVGAGCSEVLQRGET